MATYAQTVLADAPLYYLKFDETSGTTAFDSSGNGRDFTYVTSPVLGEPAVTVGDGGKSVKLTGTQHIERSDQFFNNHLGPWTLECWVSVTSLPGGVASPAFMANARGAGGITMVLGFNLPSSASFTNMIGVGFYTGSTWMAAHWTTVPSLNTRYHVVGTWDNNILRLRVNGAEVATNTVGTTGYPSFGDSAVYRMGRRWDGTQFISGWLDEAAVYDYVLPSTRADAHYAAGIDQTGVAPLSSSASLVASTSTGPVTYSSSASLSAQSNVVATTTLLSDNFNRADSSTTVGAPQIGPTPVNLIGTSGLIGQKLYCPTLVSAEGVLSWDLGVSDYDYSVTLSSVISSNAIIFRMVDGSNFMMFHIGTATSIDWYKRVGGTYTAYRTISNLTMPIGTVLRVLCIGPTILFYINGVKTLSLYDENFQVSATKVGVRLAANGRFDNVFATTAAFAYTTGTGGLYEQTIPSDTSSTSTGFIYKGRDSSSLDASGSAP